MVKTAIHWFRRDLRVADNTALDQAARRAVRVVPVFVVEDTLRAGREAGPAGLGFLLQAVAQGRKFDPEGAFVRQWVPELAALGKKVIPWEAPAALARTNYPKRIILHEEQRLQFLRLYRGVKARA